MSKYDKPKSPHKGPAVRKSGGGKGMTAGDAHSTQAGKTLYAKRKKYSEDTSSKIGASKADFGFIDSRVTRAPKTS